MESFGKFLESNDKEMKYTRTDPNNEPLHGQPSPNKKANLEAAQELLDGGKVLTLGQIADYAEANPGKVDDIAEFGIRYGFDESMPLHSLIAVYNRYAR